VQYRILFFSVVAAAVAIFAITPLAWSQNAHTRYEAAPAVLSEQAYYAFYPSSLGEDWKRFQHNIFGFSIDMPASWMFGVHTKQPAYPVIMLYPDGIDTSKFSDKFEMIEIASFPADSLDAAFQNVLQGMRVSHPGLVLDKEKKETVFVGGENALEFQISWPSKTGYSIIEHITLISYNEQIRSIAVRAVDNLFKQHEQLYQKIVHTYRPQK